MEVVPVIDLKGGVAVHARQGQRESYQPIVTPLSPSSAPVDVVAGFLRLYPFRRLYIADLDAIGEHGSHEAQLAELAARFPGLELWVDNGLNAPETALKWLGKELGCLVAGSESQRDVSLLKTLAGEERLILSLDFRGDSFQGPPEILEMPELWPSRVITMTLARVGAGQGPDLARTEAVARRRAGGLVYAAGGVRDAKDLKALANTGAAGVLVATALHSGKITASDLADAARH
jgi:phosphoribosylformimino-5-aminoimidazole carboxamide ribotide isomerase